jgi:hypothetical protein
LAVTEPSKFFTQHHAVEAPTIDERSFRPFWRRRTRLDDLLSDKAINLFVWRAGVDYRALAEMRLMDDFPAKGFDQNETLRAGSDIGIAHRIDTGGRITSINRELDKDHVRLLEAHLVDDLDWAELARRCRVHRTTARRKTIRALKALAEVVWNGGSR